MNLEIGLAKNVKELEQGLSANSEFLMVVNSALDRLFWTSPKERINCLFSERRGFPYVSIQ